MKVGYNTNGRLKQLHGARAVILALERCCLVWQPQDKIKAALFPCCVPADTHNFILRHSSFAASCGGLVSLQDAAYVSPQKYAS